MAKLTEKKIRDTILQTVSDLFKSDRDALTVRVVRNNAEAKLDLERGFLKQGAWKENSSELIRNEVTRLDEEEAPSSVKKVVEKKETKKRAAPVKKAAPVKRRKKSPTPEVESEVEREAHSSAADEDDEAEISDATKTKTRAPAERVAPAKTTARRGNKAASPSDEEELSEVAEDSDSAVSEASFNDSESDAAPRKSGKKVENDVDSEVESELSDAPEDEDSDASASLPPKAGRGAKAKPATAVKSKKPPPKSTPKSNAKSEEKVESESEAEAVSPKKKEVDTDEESNKDDSKNKYNVFKTPPSDDVRLKDEVDRDASESEMSVVLNEPPKPARKSKATTKSTTTKKVRAPAKPKTTTTTPEQEELKTLQSQLSKCGIRKVWGAYLKSFDTHKGKVDELKRMLGEAGMDGRFSESKAAEIKERRELEADIGFLEDTAKTWGVAGKTRGRRSAVQKRKNLKIESGSDEEEEGGYLEDIEEMEAERTREKAKADLAFLGDEESESD